MPFGLTYRSLSGKDHRSTPFLIFRTPFKSAAQAHSAPQTIINDAASFDNTMVPFHWKWYEPVRGQYKEPYTGNLVRWAQENHLKKKLHALIWHELCPDWVTDETVQDEYVRRISHLMEAYGNDFDFFDLANETTVNDRFDNPVSRWVRRIGRKQRRFPRGNLLLGCLFGFLFSALDDEQEHQKQREVDEQQSERDPGERQRLRRKTDQQQHRRAEHDCERAAGQQVVCRGRFEARIDLAEQHDAGTDRAGHHAVHRNERLLTIGRVDLLRKPSEPEERRDAARNRQQHERHPETGKVLDVDARDAADDHDIERKPRNAGQQIVVLILARHRLRLAECAQHLARDHRKQRADDEVKAPQQRRNGLRDARRKAGEQRIDAVGEQERQKIHKQHQRRLHGELIERFRDRDLVLVLEVRNRHDRTGEVLVRGTLALLFSRKHVDIDDADDTGAQIPRRGDRQSERASARETVFHRLEGTADVVRLSGALSVAHRQQDAACREHRGLRAIEHVVQQKRDRKTGDALHEIRRNDQRAGLRRDQRALRVLILLGHAQRQRDKADRDAVIGQHLEDRRIERVVRKLFERLRLEDPQACGTQNQKQKTGQYRRRHQRFFEERHLAAQYVRQQQKQRDEADLDDDIPKPRVRCGEVHSVGTPFQMRYNNIYLRLFRASPPFA
ncbi:MAG: endo-1,4-beta-xylanase [Clostridia bacterium]|nr:endo-1,4-beta-xylanase [Clostridia bacterium]